MCEMEFDSSATLFGQQSDDTDRQVGQAINGKVPVLVWSNCASSRETVRVEDNVLATWPMEIRKTTSHSSAPQ